MITNINTIFDRFKLKGFPKTLTPHEQYIVADALYDYMVKCEKLGGNLEGVAETAGSLYVYFGVLPSKIKITKKIIL